MILKNATIITVNEKNEILKNCDILIKDKKIVDIKKNIDGVEQEIIDCSNKVIMPGFINCHAHMPMSIFRSLAEEDDDRLRKYMFPIEGKYITPTTVEIASKFSLLETIASGQTTIADMYYYNREIASSFKELGVRSLMCETIIDQGGETFNKELGQIDHFQSLYEKYKDDELVNVGIAPHAPYTNSLENLIKCQTIANELNIKLMIHVSEMAFEAGEFRDYPSVITYLDAHKLLSANTILVHGLYLSANDLDIIAKRGCTVIHCPVSNAKGGRPIMNLKAMCERGITVGLGTDGAMSGNRLDMHSVLYFASKIHKHANKSRSYLKNQELIRMATINGAKALGLEQQIGSVEIGKQADLIIIDPWKVNMLPNYDIESSIVNALDTNNIDYTIVAGKIIYDHGHYPTVDKKEVVANFIDLTDKIAEYVKIEK